MEFKLPWREAGPPNQELSLSPGTSASLVLADYSQLHIQTSRFKPVNVWGGKETGLTKLESPNRLKEI